MEKKKERKRIWVVKAAVVLLVVLALCTAAARTVWNLLLPRVETTTVYGGMLQDQAQLEGTVHYGGQQTVRADGDWEITEILVEEGQTVEEGTPLLRVDTTRLELSVRELELQRETLGHERNRAGTTWSRIEEIDTERALLEDQIGASWAQYPADGVLTAPLRGRCSRYRRTPGCGRRQERSFLRYSPRTVPGSWSGKCPRRRCSGSPAWKPSSCISSRMRRGSGLTSRPR
ncbi:MAG: biotin/lipoyl-binding protein [Lachnospiraceae bacterium]